MNGEEKITKRNEEKKKDASFILEYESSQCTERGGSKTYVGRSSNQDFRGKGTKERKGEVAMARNKKGE